KAGLPADTASLRHAGYPGSRKARATNYLLHPPPTTSATTSARFPQHLESGRSRAASPLFVKPPQNRIALPPLPSGLDSSTGGRGCRALWRNPAVIPTRDDPDSLGHSHRRKI